MSDTDDTDVLLLIPPNFFLVHSSESEDSILDSSRTVVHKPPSCTAQVIGKLVNQVHSLENRLESLELSTTSDTISSLGTRRYRSLDISESCNSFDRKFSTFPRRRKRKQRKQDLSISSLNSTSTYDRHIPPLKLLQGLKHSESVIDDSPSMDGDISSIVSTPNKKNDKLLLHEIDEFLTKVETYESPETKFKAPDSELSPENVIKATGDYISQKLDTKNSADEIKLPSGRVVSSNALDKYIYLVRNNSLSNTQAEKPSLTLRSQHSGESKPDIATRTSQETTKSSTEIRSPSIRRLNFHDTNKDVQPTSTPKKHGPGASLSYLDTFRPSSNKIYERASKVLEQYKNQNNGNNLSSSIDTNYIISPKREEFKVPQKPYPIEMREGPKLSMYRNKFMDTIDTDLLSLSDLWGEKKDGVDRGESVKLEEERMKREHCEAIIQDLQKKLLDHQERLAVAIKVDRSKDSAITKLKDAWLRLTTSLDKAEDRHRAALDRMSREVDNFRSVADNAQKKTNHFEAELYKALDLAHDYQEKHKQLSSEKKELQENVEKALAHKDEVINSKVQEIEVLKENYETVMRLNKQSTDCVKNIEDALEKERLDHEATRVKVIELNRKIETVQDEKSLLIQERDLLKEKVNEERARGNILERQLAEKQNQSSELLNKCDNLDHEVKTLRKHIELQKNELKTHYQKQLEEAVLSKLQEFQVQLDQAEREMENENRSKENAIVDTFNKQMGRIEEQHKLEIKVLEEKHREEIKLYRLQLAQASEKISLFENKLDSYRRRRGQIASELHSVMESQWRQALQILTNGARSHASTVDLTRNDTVSTPEAHDYVAPKVPPLTIPRSSLRHEDRVRSVDMFNFEGLSDTELQHYVKMLLTKPATFHEGGGDMPQDGSTRHKELTEHNQQVTQEEPTSDRPDKDKKEKGKRSLTLSKPPWKS